MKDYFQSEVQRYGGQIVSMETYDPKGTDFSPQIQSLAGVGKALRKVGAGRKVHVDFEAVYIPDGYKSVAMLAPQFAYHDITTIRLLGTSLWHSPKLLSTTARYTQRSVIPTAFFAGSERPEVQNFVRAYRVGVGNEEAEPTQFEAYGYDAGMLLLALMDQHHVSTREDMNQALGSIGSFPGVTGRFSFGPDGEYNCEPILITVDGSEFKLIQ
jgi:ABC-type branched-subunit amino acid transport system substrate-binding protein